MQVSSSPPFFEHQHERLEAQLHAHLLDVVGADFDSALQRLQRWRADLAQHIEIENTRLLPHVPPGARWAARVYVLEHHHEREHQALAHELPESLQAAAWKGVEPGGA